jgi:hypothetical protein
MTLPRTEDGQAQAPNSRNILSAQLRQVAEQWAGNEQGVFFICAGHLCLLPTAAQTEDLSDAELRAQIERFQIAMRNMSQVPGARPSGEGGDGR